MSINQKFIFVCLWNLVWGPCFAYATIFKLEREDFTSDQQYQEMSVLLERMESRLPKIVLESYQSKGFSRKIRFEDFQEQTSEGISNYKMMAPLIGDNYVSLNQQFLGDGNSLETSDLLQREIYRALGEFIYEMQKGVQVENHQQLLDCRMGKGNCHQLELEHVIMTQEDREIFKHLSFWMKRGMVFQTRELTNNNDPYFKHSLEKRNAGGAFAVNFQLFLTDTTLKCYRPEMFNFFKDMMRVDPFPHETCANPHWKLYVDNFFNIGNPYANLTTFDPKRVYAVHYAVAGKGTSAGSWLGHSFLVFIYCGPEREEVNEECLKDINHHVAVSFAADVGGEDLSMVKGVTGQYPNRAEIRPLKNMVDFYGFVENREVLSTNIKMSREQVERAATAVHQYAQYVGKYKFFSGNCSTESLERIKCFTQHSQFLMDFPRTPFGILDSLYKHGLSEKDQQAIYENKHKKAEKDFFYWPSHGETVQKSMEMVKGLAPKFKKLEGLEFEDLKKMAPRERLALYMEIIKNTLDILDTLDTLETLNPLLTQVTHLMVLEQNISEFFLQSKYFHIGAVIQKERKGEELHPYERHFMDIRGQMLKKIEAINGKSRAGEDPSECNRRPQEDEMQLKSLQESYLKNFEQITRGFSQQLSGINENFNLLSALQQDLDNHQLNR